MRVGSSLAIVCALAAGAAAEPTYRDVQEAQLLFARGRTLLDSAKYSEACAAFARSHQLDPQAGTLYNLAGCFVKRNMLVSAWTAYRDLAVHDRNPKRRDDAAARAQKLEASLPRLRISAPQGWTVTANGVDVTGKIDIDDPVDPGAYEVVATARNEPTFRTTVTVAADGQVTKVVVRSKHALDVVDPFGNPAAALEHPVLVAAPMTDPVRARTRLYGTFALVGGAAMFAGGLGFTKLALDARHDASAELDPTLKNTLDVRARGRTEAAVVLIASGAGLAGFGAWLYWKHSVAVHVAPSGVALAGKF